MKILYLPGDYPFCYYYRGYLPGVYSNQTVVDEFVAYGFNMPNQFPYTVAPFETIKHKASSADVIVFQRPNNEKAIAFAKLLRQHGKKIIFENDDSYKIGKAIPLELLDNDEQRKIATNIDRYTNEFLALADGAIASNPFLAEEFRQINPNIAVLKNCIDPLDEFPCKANLTGKFRVGFIGSVTTNEDYYHIKDQIKRLDERGDCTLVVLGIKNKDGSHFKFMQKDFDFWSSLKNIEWHPYCNITEYMSFVASLALDVAIIPRKDSYFVRCKSNLKALEMSLLRIPVIAQGFSTGDSPYQGDLSPYLTIVTDNDEWYNAIIKVKEKHSDYKLLANKAHDYVLEHYNIHSYHQEWTNTIETLCKYQKNS